MKLEDMAAKLGLETEKSQRNSSLIVFSNQPDDSRQREVANKQDHNTFTKIIPKNSHLKVTDWSASSPFCTKGFTG